MSKSTSVVRLKPHEYYDVVENVAILKIGVEAALIAKLVQYGLRTDELCIILVKKGALLY
jgi:hypothetical protein